LLGAQPSCAHFVACHFFRRRMPLLECMLPRKVPRQMTWRGTFSWRGIPSDGCLASVGWKWRRLGIESPPHRDRFDEGLPMTKVLISPAPLAGLEAGFTRALREAGFELVYPNVSHQLSEAELGAILPGVKATLAGSE